jgi:hypothetical protein
VVPPEQHYCWARFGTCTTRTAKLLTTVWYHQNSKALKYGVVVSAEQQSSTKVVSTQPCRVPSTVRYHQNSKLVEYGVVPTEKQTCLVRCGTTRTANLLSTMWYHQNSKLVKYRYPVWYHQNSKSVKLSTGTVWYHQNSKRVKYRTVPENIFSWGGIKIRDKVPVDGFPNFGYCGMKLPKQIRFILKKCT